MTEVFNWTRNPVEARRLAARREAVLAELLGGRKPLVPPGVTQLMAILQKNQVGGGGGWQMGAHAPTQQHRAGRAGKAANRRRDPPPPLPQAPLALVSSAPEQRVLPALEAAGLSPHFDVVVTADDVYRGKPDPEGFLYAAQRLQRPPVRCVVIGNSNLSIEAAHEVRLGQPGAGLASWAGGRAGHVPPPPRSHQLHVQLCASPAPPPPRRLHPSKGLTSCLPALPPPAHRWA